MSTIPRCESAKCTKLPLIFEHAPCGPPHEVVSNVVNVFFFFCSGSVGRIVYPCSTKFDTNVTDPLRQPIAAAAAFSSKINRRSAHGRRRTTVREHSGRSERRLSSAIWPDRKRVVTRYARSIIARWSSSSVHSARIYSVAGGNIPRRFFTAIFRILNPVPKRARDEFVRRTRCDGNGRL